MPPTISGGTYTTIIRQGSPGNMTLTWNSVYKFEGAADVAWFISDGVNLYGRLIKDIR